MAPRLRPHAAENYITNWGGVQPRATGTSGCCHQQTTETAPIARRPCPDQMPRALTCLIVDARPEADGPLAAGARAAAPAWETAWASANSQGPARGRDRPASAAGRRKARSSRICVCDAVAMLPGGWRLIRHSGPVRWQGLTSDSAGAFFPPDHARPPTDQNGQGFCRSVRGPRMVHCMPPKL